MKSIDVFLGQHDNRRRRVTIGGDKIYIDGKQFAILNGYTEHWFAYRHDHFDYWIKIREKYPEIIEVAKTKYGAEVEGYLSPEFETIEDLLLWLEEFADIFLSV